MSALNAPSELAAAQAGDAEAMRRLVEGNLALVHSVVKRFLNRGAEYDDLMQLGSLGLVKAIRNYQPDYGVMFSTYAVPAIMGEIRRFLRDDGIVHVSRGIRERAIHLSGIKSSLTQALGRDPTVQELADEAKMPAEDIAFALDALDAPRSLDAPAYQEDTVSYGELLPDRSIPDIHERIWLRDAIAKLPERDRKLIFMRFFHDQSQAQVGRALGISQVQVSRLEMRILKRLREG